MLVLPARQSSKATRYPNIKAMGKAKGTFVCIGGKQEQLSLRIVRKLELEGLSEHMYISLYVAIHSLT